MGKSYQGIHGNYQGKVGNVVAREKDGRTILSIYVRHPQNPRTTKQQTVREKFAMISRFASHFETVAKEFCRGLFPYGNYYSNMIKLNPADTVINTASTPWEIRTNKWKLSKGSLPVGDSDAAVIDSGMLSVSWNDNTGDGDALGTDQCALIVYNSVKGATLMQKNAGTRTSRQATLTLPTAWSGDSVDIWCVFHSAEGDKVSDSEYLGNLSI